MASFREIDYSVRPAKSVERKIMTEAFRRLELAWPISTYRYIGMGSVYFADFLLIHQALGIDDMVSIEREEQYETRFEFNRPFRCVDIRFGKSSDVLHTLDWNKRSIVWLDYDGKLNSSVVSDVQTVVQNLVSGSVLAASINVEVDRAPPEIAVTAATLAPGELKDVASMATKLTQASDAVSVYLYERLSDATRKVIADYLAVGPYSSLLRPALLHDLNEIIGGESIYECERFSGVELREETKHLSVGEPTDSDLARLNRMLLEDTYHVELSKKLFGAESVDAWRLAEFEKKVGQSFLPSGLLGKNLRGKGFSAVCWRILNAAVAEQLTKRNGRPEIRPDTMVGHQIFHFRYSDGALMLTVGWLFHSHADESKARLCAMEGSYFRSGEDSYAIEAPKLTPKEIRYLNARLPDGPPVKMDSVGQLELTTGINVNDINKFAAVYRYYPQYGEIAL